jgi:hypothetical protein
VPEQVVGAARTESTLKYDDPNIPVLKQVEAEYEKLK